MKISSTKKLISPLRLIVKRTQVRNNTDAHFNQQDGTNFGGFAQLKKEFPLYSMQINIPNIQYAASKKSQTFRTHH